MTVDHSVQHGEDTQQPFTSREQVKPNSAHRITELLDHLTVDIKGSCFPLICHLCDSHSVQDKRWLFLAASVVLRAESWQTLCLKRRGLIFSLKASQLLSITGSMVNCVNSLIPSHPTV